METFYMLVFGVAAAITVVVLIKTLEPGHHELKLTSRVAFGAAFVFMISLVLGALGIVPTEKILSYTAAFLWGIWVLEVFSPTPLLKSNKKAYLAKEEPGKMERIV